MNKIYLVLSFFLVMILSACVDRTFDEPEFLFEDPDLEVTMSIAALKSTHVEGQYELLSDNDIIAGVVVGNDKSGNFYETIVIADESGGIEVKIDKRSLFNTFPVGRRVFIKLDGLVMGDYNELIQLGYASSEDGFIGIPSERMDDFIVGGSLNNEFRVDTLSLSQLDANYMSMLVTLKDVQFSDAELGRTYADALYKETKNRIIVSCGGDEVILRTSGYASFAASELPNGKGYITAVMSRYRDDWQLYLRDTLDISFDGPRCGAGSGNESLIDIIDLRNDYNNGVTGIGDELKIQGTIISDRVNNNIHEQNAVVQGATGGLVLRFPAAHELNLGDEVEVIISGMEMSDYNGLLQISNLQLSAVTKNGNNPLQGIKKTVAEILSNAEALESTLVLIEGAGLSGGASFGGNLTVDDGSGEITLYTRSVASFAEEAVPGGQVNIVAIVGDFGGAQLNLRTREDVTGGSIDPPGEVIFEEGFESGIGNWTNYNVLGDQVWEHSPQYGNPGACARVSGFEDGAHANEDWFISPALDLTGATKATLKFETAMNYTGNVLETYLGIDYDGSGNPNDFDWDQIEVNLSTGSWSWVGSGNVDLEDYLGANVYLAFKFTSTDQESSTWEVDNVEVSASY